MKHFELLLKVITLLRPQFYNKLTWFIVISGIALMSTPLWQEIIAAILRSRFDLDLVPGDSVTWGFALVVVGLVYHFATTSLFQYSKSITDSEKNIQRNTHDRQIFEESIKILTEEELASYLDWLANDHSYRENAADKVAGYHDYHAKPKNRFINEDLNSAALNMVRALGEILSWTSLNFWVYPENQKRENTRFCMHPELNLDRQGHGTPEQMQMYDELTKTLNELIRDVSDTYTSYRKKIKEQLFI